MKGSKGTHETVKKSGEVTTDSKQQPSKQVAGSKRPSNPPMQSVKDIEQSKIEEGKKLIKEYISKKYWSLFLDLFLLFAISIAYGIVLFLTESYVGQIFLIFAIICCIMISINQYRDMKRDIDVALSDLEIIMG